MPVLDVTIKGQMHLPEVSTGPVPPGSGGTPTHPIVIPPDAIAPGVPAHPIYLPPAISGGPGSLPPFAMPPIVIPPEFIADNPHPEHPIVIPPPLGFWGGVAPPHVDIGGPGPQPGPSHPIVIPPDLGIWGPTDPRPTHPIVIPPATPTVPPRPTHPIVMPPEGPPTVLDKWDVVAYWTPMGGWGMAIVPGEGHDTPIVTPSGRGA